MGDLSNENIVHIKSGDVEYIQFKRLLEYKNIIHCFTLKPLDFCGFENYEPNKEKVEKAFNIICKELDVKYKDICRSKQTHTNRVEKVKNGDEGIYNPKFNDVDALITDKIKKALVLSFADCTPLLFYDPVKNIIGNTHSGWKGTYQEIGVKTVENLIKEYNCNPKDIICCIGPHIRKCHFEVDEDVKDMFYNKFRNLKGVDGYIIRNGEKYNIDTLEINKQILLNIGFKEENIIDSEICTVCESDVCHSFRKEKDKSGRSISLIELIK